MRLSTLKKYVRGCLWAHEKVLVSLRTDRATGLSAPFVTALAAAGVDCVVNLLSEDQFRAAGADTLFGPVATLSRPPASASARPRVNMVYVFWPDDDAVPTARQVRLTLDGIDEAHAVGLTVLLHGAGVPSRAVLAAACWLAREGCSANAGDDASARLSWLYDRHEGVRHAARRVNLNEERRAFVRDWPGGRNAEPVLGVTELLDDTEPYPTATVEHWLRTLPTVRVYPEGRDGRCRTVPVIAETRVSDGTIDLGLCDLHAGTWIGERTLRLLDGAVVVFISASQMPNR